MYEEDKFPGSRATDIPRVQMQIDDKLEEIRNANGKPTFFFLIYSSVMPTLFLNSSVENAEIQC